MITVQTSEQTVARPAQRFSDERSRWQAVQRRDPSADGYFWYSVASTGVYCYPSCAARTARRENVAFHRTREEARRAGFRPCKRCLPDLPPRRVRTANAVAEVCRIIDGAQQTPGADELAAAVQMKPRELQRQFKTLTGVTLKQYAMARRAERLREALHKGHAVTDAVYEAGYGAPSRFYEKSRNILGMRPAAYARGGQNQTIRWDVTDCWLGTVLIGATEHGLCAVLFGASRAELARELAARFPLARLEEADAGSDFAAWVERTVAFIAEPTRELDLPLALIGTAFQQQVWNALREIPPGRTATYREIARRIGKPNAARAVGTACGSNPVAVLIPCHRVIASDGSLGGYRWGLARKRALLDKELAD